jgi:deoxyribodipyrimidine photo-lyase
MIPLSVIWFRRDLRLRDNHALSMALSSGAPVLPLFIFDSNILRTLPAKDARVEFIRSTLESLDRDLRRHGSELLVMQGEPAKVWAELLKRFAVKAVFCNEDYEPYAVARDRNVAALVTRAGATFHLLKDQVIWAKDEVLKGDGTPYRMFTPYSRTWLEKLTPSSTKSFSTKLHNISQDKVPRGDLTAATLGGYGLRRDQLALDATTHIGLHLRFGTLSVREAVEKARLRSPILLKELIWREFFMQLLHHFPETATKPFDRRYEKIKWRKSKADFARWARGETGYPLVDAGIRELNQTGFMHNRARMVTASFLTKHLLIDWRRGERYFAAKLLDFELASNVGNWQWVAGCGCDAAPYFRVFNPELQAKKFDPQGQYIKKWVPEFGSSKYPKPMVDHEYARRRVLAEFNAALRR